jgi:hypothetical protein
MHERGYNFFTIPKLTLPEINLLIREFNRREKEMKREMQKNKNNNKR